MQVQASFCNSFSDLSLDIYNRYGTKAGSLRFYRIVLMLSDYFRGRYSFHGFAAEETGKINVYMDAADEMECMKTAQSLLEMLEIWSTGNCDRFDELVAVDLLSYHKLADFFQCKDVLLRIDELLLRALSIENAPAVLDYVAGNSTADSNLLKSIDAWMRCFFPAGISARTDGNVDFGSVRSTGEADVYEFKKWSKKCDTCCDSASNTHAYTAFGTLRCAETRRSPTFSLMLSESQNCDAAECKVQLHAIGGDPEKRSATCRVEIVQFTSNPNWHKLYRNEWTSKPSDFRSEERIDTCTYYREAEDRRFSGICDRCRRRRKLTVLPVASTVRFEKIHFAFA